MPKLRVTCTITVEYDIVPEHYYGPTTTGEEALNVDLDEFSNDHDMFFEIADTKNAVYEFTGEILP